MNCAKEFSYYVTECIDGKGFEPFLVFVGLYTLEQNRLSMTFLNIPQLESQRNNMLPLIYKLQNN